jgi:hypothetical protein
MSGGRMSGKINCKEQGASMTMSMEGTHTRTSYDMSMKAEMEGMALTTKISAKRVGECTPPRPRVGDNLGKKRKGG